MIKPIVLLILDGWGIAPPGPGNVISLAKTPNYDRFLKNFANTKLLAAGEAVGLPKGEDGNTETGHLNIGAGQIVYQDLARINHAIADGSFFQIKAFLQAIKHTQNFNSSLHLMGLIGSGGVHSNNEHLFALMKLAQTHKVKRLFLHLFTDGRDSPPTSAITFVSSVESETQKIGIGKIASISGRYYAMDRDLRWQRTQKAYQALTQAQGKFATSAQLAVEQSYAKKVTDEFIKPTIITDSAGQPVAKIQNNDAIIFFNFRVDRPRQLTKAFILNEFENYQAPKSFDPYDIKYHHTHSPKLDTSEKPFTRAAILKNINFVTMTEYEKDLPTTIAFPPQSVEYPLGKVLSENNINQLRLAETEKERFVTYYFNGQREDPYRGEDRIIIPSAKVPTYDLKPQMATQQTMQILLEKTAAPNFDVYIVNFAAADMVAHTGNINATIKACEFIDQAIGTICMNILGQKGIVLITADHGNAEELINSKSGEVDTEHSANPVPFILVADQFMNKTLTMQQGILADIAPTILKLLEITPPKQMTGRSLI